MRNFLFVLRKVKCPWTPYCLSQKGIGIFLVAEDEKINILAANSWFINSTQVIIIEYLIKLLEEMLSWKFESYWKKNPKKPKPKPKLSDLRLSVNGIWRSYHWEWSPGETFHTCQLGWWFHYGLSWPDGDGLKWTEWCVRALGWQFLRNCVTGLKDLIYRLRNLWDRLLVLASDWQWHKGVYKSLLLILTV